MDTACRMQEELNDVFDLATPLVHNRTEITGSQPLSILTDSQQWSYAVAFRLRGEVLDSQLRGPILVRVRTTVESGRVGALLVADDLQTVFGTSTERSGQGGEVTLEVLVDALPHSGWLVLRNHAVANMPSRCQVHSIQTLLGCRQPEDIPGALSSVVIPGAHAIDLDLLASATAEARARANIGGNTLAILQRKWSEVPAGLVDRRRTTDLIAADDEELNAFWTRIHNEATTGEGYPVRGWYHDLYKDVLREKRVLDVGSGLGIDGITFAHHGAQITFVDIVESNLLLVQRLCRIRELKNVNFLHLHDVSALDALPNDFDVIWCQGSMINAPFSFMQIEVEALLRHLPVGGRWIELAYPRERWEREGRMPFSEWGKITDGEGTPWMEWYDLDRLRARLRPAEFDVVLHFNFHHDDFNWFDLIRRK